MRLPALKGRWPSPGGGFVLAGVCCLLAWCAAPQAGRAGQAIGAALDPCPRPAAGSALPQPVDLRSENGELRLDLRIRNARQKDGSVHYCYVLADGAQAPTLRVHPGDHVLLRLHNEIDNGQLAAADRLSPMGQSLCTTPPARTADPCASGAMGATATNLHFHGMTLQPVCHQDEVLKTSVPAGAPFFEYRYEVPRSEAPGLYWYHPHIHGFSSRQVQGGASGALIVEGLERSVPEVAGLPERVLVIRDQELLNPQAAPARSEPTPPKSLMESDGDALNNGSGFGKPAKDLSINFVPVPYPLYPPATLRMKPGERQLWRVLNASSVTYLNLAWLVQRRAQPLGVVAIDGVARQAAGGVPGGPLWTDHLMIPPAGRAEFIVEGPPAGNTGLLVTRSVDTGPAGENDPNRALAVVQADPQAPEPASRLPGPSASAAVPATDALTPLRQLQPVRTRRLYFSEKPLHPEDPNSPTEFYITVDGRPPKVFDPKAGVPDIEVHQGDVEDWIIENRSNELHAFHIHQIHFLVMDLSGQPLQEPFVRDTVNVPYFKPQMLSYPSVRLRMDFRDPNTVGTFVYHCHLLEHEDGGMMGTVRVLPRHRAKG